MGAHLGAIFQPTLAALSQHQLLIFAFSGAKMSVIPSLAGGGVII